MKMSKCFTMGAKQFEKKLEEIGVSFNQLKEINNAFEELTIEEKAEVNDLLRTFED